VAEVELEKINKRYANGFHAIRDLDLKVRDGEFLILVGPSGCGKSTALRMIAGLEDVSEGDLRIGGRRVVDIAPKYRDIAMVFQNYALYPNMSVHENIGFSMKLAGVKRVVRDERVRRVAKMLELEPMLQSKPGQLSGGQRQRVAMGRAMVREPAVFLMDEPLSNLDAKLRVQMRSEIARLQRRLGITTIYVTHDQVEAMTMGDRVAVLKDGVLQQVDTPTALYRKPANAFVAGFIGSPAMNLFAAQVQAGALLLGQGAPLALGDHAWLSGRDGQRLVVGIRPEDIQHADGGAADGRIKMGARVSSVEELGAEHVAHLGIDARKVDSGDPDAIADVGSDANTVARFAPTSCARAGDDIVISIDPHKLHFFDVDSHRALERAGPVRLEGVGA